jgi:pimeloyl-CoA dehydrogenase small subunit
MDFDLSEEQRLLQDSVGRLLSDHYAFTARRNFSREPDGWSHDMWRQYGELGILGLPFDESVGGMGATGVETMLVMEAFGRAAILEPYLASVVLGGTAIKLAGSAAQKSALLPGVADGSRKLAFAHGERQARHDLTDVLTTAKKDSSGWVLEGAKSVVLHGDCADTLIVSARTAGARDAADGISLFIVDANAEGVARRGYKLHDATQAAEISLSGVRVPENAVLGKVDGGLATIQRVMEAGIAATAAEAVGAMEVLNTMTVDYLKTRVQFGKPIGENQVLQHKAAEMLVELEQGRSMAMLAAMMLEEPDAEERARNMAMVKVHTGRCATFVAKTAVQLHGGIGMTEELAIATYFRRIMVIEQLFGDTANHLARLGEQVA